MTYCRYTPLKSPSLEEEREHKYHISRTWRTGYFEYPFLFAGEEDNPAMRLLVIRVLFAIYRFYTDSWMDLDEDIPGLLVGNTTPEERQVIAGWLLDALSQIKAEGSAARQPPAL